MTDSLVSMGRFGHASFLAASCPEALALRRTSGGRGAAAFVSPRAKPCGLVYPYVLRTEDRPSALLLPVAYSRSEFGTQALQHAESFLFVLTPGLRPWANDIAPSAQGDRAPDIQRGSSASARLGVLPVLGAGLDGPTPQYSLARGKRPRTPASHQTSRQSQTPLYTETNFTSLWLEL